MKEGVERRKRRGEVEGKRGQDEKRKETETEEEG